MKLSFFTNLKYYLVRIIERIPLIQILIYNNISYFSFFSLMKKIIMDLKNLLRQIIKKIL